MHSALLSRQGNRYWNAGYWAAVAGSGASAFPGENGSIASTKIGSNHNFNIWVMSLEQQRRASRVGERRFSEPL